jgi:hypothetical protein
MSGEVLLADRRVEGTPAGEESLLHDKPTLAKTSEDPLLRAPYHILKVPPLITEAEGRWTVMCRADSRPCGYNGVSVWANMMMATVCGSPLF